MRQTHLVCSIQGESEQDGGIPISPSTRPDAKPDVSAFPTQLVVQSVSEIGNAKDVTSVPDQQVCRVRDEAPGEVLTSGTLSESVQEAREIVVRKSQRKGNQGLAVIDKLLDETAVGVPVGGARVAELEFGFHAHQPCSGTAWSQASQRDSRPVHGSDSTSLRLVPILDSSRSNVEDVLGEELRPIEVREMSSSLDDEKTPVPKCIRQVFHARISLALS